MSTVHIVGAGVAGLAAAVTLVKAGYGVTLYDQAGHAGGRCRSFHDATLDRRIDNGNHLLLGGNHAVRDYLSDIGAGDSLIGPDRPLFPFVDLATGRRWVVRPNLGRIPWWIAVPTRRVPGTVFREYFSGLRLARAKPQDTVADCFDTRGTLYQRFWRPLALAALNTAPEEAAAKLLWPVVLETFGRGGMACRPLVARHGLSESFVDPAVRWLTNHGVSLRYGQRLRQLDWADDRVAGLDFGRETRVDIGPADRLVLAIPPGAVHGLFPSFSVPPDSRAIVNAHFRVDSAPRLPENSPVLGVLGGTAEWIFCRGDIVSVTVSAADRLAGANVEAIAAKIWGDVVRALDLSGEPMVPWRVVKEKRATFAQTPAALPLRPCARTAYRNLFLAGDWTDTGLPATLEGAIRSGRTAASRIQEMTD